MQVSFNLQSTVAGQRNLEVILVEKITSKIQDNLTDFLIVQRVAFHGKQVYGFEFDK